MYRRDRHMRSHSRVDATRDVVLCRLCSKHCDTSSYLDTHLHSHPLIYFCSVCSAFFPSSLRLASHLNVHQSLSSSLSSTDLFWQSIAVSVLMTKSTSSHVSWLTGIDTVCDEQSNDLDDVLQDMHCSSVTGFSHSDTEILAGIGNGTLEYCQEDVQCRDAEDTSTSSLDITCIDQNVCLKLGYKPMSQDIFKQLRETFGCSECEYCGQLFGVQSDLDAHMNIHSGRFYCPLCLLCLTYGSHSVRSF